MKDVLSVSKKPAPQSHRSPKRPEKGAPKNTRPSLPASAFLPTTRAEADARGWDAARLRLRFRRRLRGSSLVRQRHHHAGAGVPRLQSGLHRSARLERPGKRRGVRRAAAGIPRVGGQHGLHGEPLHGEQEAPPRRRLHAGRQGRRAPQPRGRGLFEPHSPHLQGNAHHFGRHRGESAPARPLRLLVRFPQALHLARFRGRPHLLRHGGALYRRDCRCPRCGPFRERSHLHRRHGVPHALAGTRGRLRDAAQVGRGFGRQARLRGELRRPVPRERPGDVAAAWWKPTPMACMWCRTRRLRR